MNNIDAKLNKGFCDAVCGWFMKTIADGDKYSSAEAKGELKRMAILSTYYSFVAWADVGRELIDKSFGYSCLVDFDEFKASVTGEELFGILSKYSFSYNEYESDSQLLTPCILGDLFENLIGIVTDGVQSIRKKTGSFYTPYAIVDSMCKKCLAYNFITQLYGVHNKLNQDSNEYKALETKINKLVNEHDASYLSGEERCSLLPILFNETSFLEPAVGCGNFVVCMMENIFLILKTIDPSNMSWVSYIINDTNTEDHQIHLSNVRSYSNNPDFIRKLYIIYRCVNAIDILPMAVEITKMRIWLWLIHSKDAQYFKEYFGTLFLPSLDSQVVCGDFLKTFSSPVAKKESKSKVKCMELF